MEERDDSQETQENKRRNVPKWRALTAIFTLATVAYAWRSRRSHGTFLKVPYEFRVPTMDRIRSRWWNPDDNKVFTPRVFGVGWTINFHRVLRLLGLVKKGGEEPVQEELEEEAEQKE